MSDITISKEAFESIIACGLNLHFPEAMITVSSQALGLENDVEEVRSYFMARDKVLSRSRTDKA
jgi:hypothetical protein